MILVWRQHWIFLALLTALTCISAIALLVFRSHLLAAWDLMRLMALTRSVGEFSLPLMGGSHLMPSSDPHFGPYLVIVAALWRLSGGTSGNLERVYALFGVLGTILMTLTLYRLCLQVVGRPARATACVASAFLLWGPVHTFWAGDYSVIGTMYASMYPQAMAYAIGFACISHGIRYMVAGRRRDLALLAVLFLVLSLTHLFTSIFVILSLVCLASVQPRPRDGLPLAAAVGIGGAFTLLWPLYGVAGEVRANFETTLDLALALAIGVGFLVAAAYVVRAGWIHRGIVQGTVRRYRLWLLASLIYLAWMVRVVIIKGLLFFTAPIDKRLLGGTGLAGFIGLRNLDPATYYLLTWSGCSLVIYWGGKAADKVGISFPLWHRFIFFGMLPLHILLGMIIFDNVTSLKTRRARSLSVALLLGMVVVFGISGTRVLTERESFISPEVGEVYSLIPDGAVVIADGSTSEILAGYFGATTLWPILSEEGYSERLDSVNRFFDPETPGEALLGLAREYGADALVLRIPRDEQGNGTAVLAGKFDGLFKLEGENQRYRIYSIPGPGS